MFKKILTLSFLVVLTLSACKNKTDESQNVSLEEKKSNKYDKPIDINYTLWNLKSNDSLKKVFKNKFTPQELTTLVSLNGRDKSTIFQADSVIVPDKFEEDFLVYSPFPYQVTSLKDVNKIALFSYAIQAYALYENGNLVKWGPTSMGSKKHLTPTGLFFTNWKGEEIQSSFDDEWVLKWNFNIENKEGIGWHQYALPGYPASHSCLRLLEQDAKWMYDWASEWVLADKETVKAKGTPVIVFGSYDFSKKGPWLNLAEDNKSNRISSDILEAEIKKYLPEILKEQENSILVAQQTTK
ncbi:MAG: L,D-transpeptidase [Flavobacterium sp.]|nr:L,D-transpeptidase [Candidatus Neoflavobacterium equi]